MKKINQKHIRVMIEAPAYEAKSLAEHYRKDRKYEVIDRSKLYQYGIGHQQELMNTAPEAWKLANDIAAVAYAYTQTPLDLREYETQLTITDTADRIRNQDTISIRNRLNDIGENSANIDIVRKAFQLVVRISQYDGEWEPAPKNLDKIFDGRSKSEKIPKEAFKIEPEQASLMDRLEAKSKEADALNSNRQAMQQPIQKQQEI